MRRLKLFTMVSIMLLAGIGSGCATSKTQIHGFNLISVDEEKKLGDNLAGEIEKQYKVVNDPEVQAYADRLGKKLLTGVREQKFNYTFKVVQDDSVNAFAIPGGHVYIQTGLLKAADNEDELAGVLAHEVNHVVARHGTQQMTRQYGYELLAQLVLGQNPGMLSQLAASLFGKAGSLAYSRSMERQADYLGVETMSKAGFNPDGMLKFFEKLDTMQHQNPSALTRFLSSHPLTTDRIQAVKNEIAKLPPKKYLPEDSPEFEKVKEKIR